MKKILSSFMAALLCLTALLPAGFAASKPVVLNIDGKTVTLEEFNKLYKMAAFSYQQQYGDDIMTQSFNGVTVKKTVEAQLLQNLVNRELISRYLLKNKISVDAKAIEKDLNAFMANVIKDKAVETYYKANGIDRAFIKSALTAEYQQAKFMQHFEDAVLKDQKQLEKAFAQEALEVDASHILVPDEASAKQVLTRLKNGEDFAALAKELSLDPGSAVDGGKLGYFKRGVMVTEFETAAFKTPVGQISEAVKTQFGYHIILVNGKKTLKDLMATGVDSATIAEYKQALVKRLATESANAQLKILEKASKITKYPNLIK